MTPFAHFLSYSLRSLQKYLKLSVFSDLYFCAGECEPCFGGVCPLDVAVYNSSESCEKIPTYESLEL